MSNDPNVKVTKFSRTRTGCLACRRAKHKCDESKPSCRRCGRQQLICVYPKKAAPKRQKDGGDWIVRAGSRSAAVSSAVIAQLGQSSGSPCGSASPPLSWSDLLSGPTISTELSPPDWLAFILPDADERSLMQHFLCFGTVNMCAIPQPDKPIQFFDISFYIRNPRGSSTIADSQLLSLMAIAAVHRSSLLLQQQQGYLTSSPTGKWGSPSPPIQNLSSGEAFRMRRIGAHLSKSAIDISRVAIVLKSNMDDISDDILTSLIATMISQSMLGDSQHWKDALDLALEIIQMRDGPTAMLEKAKQKSPENLRKTLSLLEKLAFVDVVHCLSAGVQPRILTEPFPSWWFEYSFDDTPNDTFQYGFGLHRGLLELLNRVNMLIHDHTLSSLLCDRLIGQNQLKANDTLLELDIWFAKINFSTPLSRVDLGNMVIIQTMRVLIYTQILAYPASHHLVQTWALTALQQLDEGQKHYVIGLLIPKIILGSVMLDAEGQDLAKRTILNLRSTVSYSYDVEEALRVLESLLSQRREGNANPSWHAHLAHQLLF